MLGATLSRFDQTTTRCAFARARAAKARDGFDGRSRDGRRRDSRRQALGSYRFNRRRSRGLIEQIKQTQHHSQQKPRPAFAGQPLRTAQLHGAFITEKTRQPTALRRERVAAFRTKIAVVAESSHRPSRIRCRFSEFLPTEYSKSAAR